MYLMLIECVCLNLVCVCLSILHLYSLLLSSFRTAGRDVLQIICVARVVSSWFLPEGTTFSTVWGVENELSVCIHSILWNQMLQYDEESRIVHLQSYCEAPFLWRLCRVSRNYESFCDATSYLITQKKQAATSLLVGWLKDWGICRKISRVILLTSLLDVWHEWCLAVFPRWYRTAGCIGWKGTNLRLVTAEKMWLPKSSFPCFLLSAAVNFCDSDCYFSLADIIYICRKTGWKCDFSAENMKFVMGVYSPGTRRPTAPHHSFKIKWGAQ